MRNPTELRDNGERNAHFGGEGGATIIIQQDTPSGRNWWSIDGINSNKRIGIFRNFSIKLNILIFLQTVERQTRHLHSQNVNFCIFIPWLCTQLDILPQNIPFFLRRFLFYRNSDTLLNRIHRINSAPDWRITEYREMQSSKIWF